MPLAQAVDKAVDSCIKEGILADFLRKNKAEVKKVSIYEYDEEKHIRMEKEYAMKVGAYINAITMITRQLHKGHSEKDTADILEEPEELVCAVSKLSQENPELQPEDLYKLLEKSMPDLNTSLVQAVDNRISEGSLTDFLRKNKAEGKKVSIYEYDAEKHIRMEKEYAMKVGAHISAITDILAVLRKGYSKEETADLLDEPEELVHAVSRLSQENPELQPKDLYKLLEKSMPDLNP